MFTDKTITIVGCGTMGEAMVRGLLAQKVVSAEQIIATNPFKDRLAGLQAKHGIRVSTNNSEAAEAGQVIVLAIKPQTLYQVTHELRGHLRRQDLLISIIAGTPIKNLADGVAHAAVVRSMPNTPAQIGQGITVWTATPEVSDLHKDQTKAILGSLGQEIYVEDERYLDMATALSGSGPGYVFMMMEAMIDAGVHLGFSRRVAEQLVFQTMRGSVSFAEQSGKHVAELRNQVTSPGGTTAAALYHMEKGGLRTVISRGVWAAYERSVELGRGEGTKSPK
jgi:pyrroline-5-carboxylate reductase